MNDTTVSQQWATRPNDQRFLTVEDLYQKVAKRRTECRVEDVALDAMKVGTTEDGNGLALVDHRGVVSGMLNHWSFNQLCARAKAPAGYLRTLPPQLAAIPLQWSMETHETTDEEGNDAKLMIRQNGETIVSSITSPSYGRIWDSEVVKAVRDNVDLSRWVVPSASYQGADPLRATTLYASDRDVFMFLVNEEAIEADGEVLRRGFYVWNSEVGKCKFGIASFTYDRVCDNRIIWGQSNFKEISIRHTSGAPHRFVASAVPQLEAYSRASAGGIVDTVRAAKAKEVGKDRKSVVEWMRARGFTAVVAGKAYEAAEADPRGYNPRSVWGLVQGVTDTAHDITHTDERATLEAKAGELLESLAA